jgi:hypothetical protein
MPKKRIPFEVAVKVLEILEIYDECRCNWKSLDALRERETIYML